MSEFAVIGLGRFGLSLARHLSRQGASVLVVDTDQELVDDAASEVDVAICADATDEQTLEELRLDRLSCVVVAVGAEALEASILITALMSQKGVPRIVARAMTALHARILRAVGADEVINPEAEMGRRLALRLAQPTILEQVDLGDSQLAEVEVPESFVQRSLLELDLRNRYQVSVIAIQRQGTVIANPRATETLASGDVLIVVGALDPIRRLANLA